MSQNKLPTAEAFLDPSDELMDKHDVEEALIAFAKLHVEAALRAAAENAKWTSESHEMSFGDMSDFDFKDVDYAGDSSTGYTISVNKESILNAYPLDNIK